MSGVILLWIGPCERQKDLVENVHVHALMDLSMYMSRLDRFLNSTNWEEALFEDHSKLIASDHLGSFSYSV